MPIKDYKRGVTERLDLATTTRALQEGAHGGLEEWQAALDPIIGDDPSPERLAFVSRIAAQPAVFRPLIEAALTDVRVVNEGSYRNAGLTENEGYGPQAVGDYVHITLGRKGGVPYAGERWDASFHAWLPETDHYLDVTPEEWGGLFKTVGFKHDHVRNIGSTVLFGDFTDIVYKEVASGGMRVIPYRGLFSPEFRTRIAPVGNRTITAGSTHIIRPEMIHEVTISPGPSSPVCTFAFRGPKKRQSFTYSEHVDETFYGYAPHAVDTEKALVTVKKLYDTA